MKKFAIPTLPEYKTTLPFLGKEVTFRPFTVAEEKILMIAKESDIAERKQQIEDSIIQILKSCLLTPGIDVTLLSSIDIEWLLLQLRIKSIGPTVDIYFNCINEVNKKKCNGRIETVVDLAEVKINTPEIKKSLVMNFNGKVHTIEFLPLSLNLIKESEKLLAKKVDFSDEKDLVVLYNMVDKIYDDKELYTKDDLSLEEFSQFINIFTPIQRQELQDFFSKVPHLEYNLDLVCPVCGNETKYHLKKLEDFF